MSTEFTQGDLLRSWGTVKSSSKMAFGLVKGAMWLSKKAISSSQNNQRVDAISPAIQSPTPCGVVFGRHGEKYIVKPYDADGHVLVVGGVGSGKSSCVAIPTLRSWKHTTFAIDIKGELYEKAKSRHISCAKGEPSLCGAMKALENRTSHGGHAVF